MAIIGSFGFGGMSGQIDLQSESLLGALEGSASFAPSPLAAAGIFGPSFGAPSFQVGANPLMQMLPLLLGAFQGLGQGWAGYTGNPYQGGGGAPFQAPQRAGNASHCQ